MTFTFWLSSTSRLVFKMQPEFQIHSNSLDRIPSGFTPGEIDWSLFHFQNISVSLINICSDLPQERTQLFPWSPLWLLFITTLGTAAPRSVQSLWCNVNNMQKTVWIIPINAVTRLLWVFYCVVTCIVLSILSWKTSIESLVMLLHTGIPQFRVDFSIFSQWY